MMMTINFSVFILFLVLSSPPPAACTYRGIRDICTSFGAIELGKFYTNGGLKVDVIDDNFSNNVTVEIQQDQGGNKKSAAVQQRAFVLQKSNGAKLNGEAIVICDRDDRMSVGNEASSKPITSMLTSVSHCSASVNFTMAVYRESKNDMKLLRVHCAKTSSIVEGPCIDRFSKCTYWKNKLCWGNFNNWMRKNCPESCSFCKASKPVVPEVSCTDEKNFRRSCVMWKERNLCHVGKWAPFVQKKCRASCKLC